jgi:hypothetical protein
VLLGFFEDFKKIFTECNSLTVQNSILPEVQKYCRTHYLSHNSANERYDVFYKIVADETNQLRIQYNKSNDASKKTDGTKKFAKANASENIPDYSNGINTRKKTDCIKKIVKANVSENIPDHIKGVNARLRDGKQDENFAFAIYFWFHAFAKSLSYAQIIDEKILKDYPELHRELKEIKVKIFEARPIKPVQPNCELTEEQSEKLTDQIERLGYDGLISIWIKGVSLSDENGGTVEGEFYCRGAGVYLECDGLDYDFNIGLTTAIVEFIPKGIVLERRKILDVTTGKMEVDYYPSKGSSANWTIIVESKEGTSALKGELLASLTDNVLFYTKPDGKADKNPTVTAKHMLERNHIKITHTGDEACDDNKIRLISRKLKREILEVCGEQIVTCLPESEEKFAMRKKAYD